MGGAVGLVRALATLFTKKAAMALAKAIAKRAAKGAASECRYEIRSSKSHEKDQETMTMNHIATRC